MSLLSIVRPFNSQTLLLISLFALPAQSQTPVCQAPDPALDASHLSARYRISNDKGETRELTLLRSPNRVIYQHHPHHFELWDRRGDYVRYFPSAKRSVTYAKGDLLSLNMQVNFDKLNQLMSPKTLQHSTLQSKDTCQAWQHYHALQTDKKITLTWHESLALPQSLTAQSANELIHYQLIELKAFSETAFNQQIAGYQDIDFADVGDNESDPFLAKMIHQGFIQQGSSGFYDSQGNPLSAAGHSH
ncbi:hypothetical protein N9W21_04260 [Shewanella sp.]|nr:hypothetical protein [Shewanella sp.]